jgi:tetratricopeptide (TPR) repeat protein
MDETVWPYDQAWYGKHSVELFYTLVHSPSTWLAAMLHVLPERAPAIVWVGQFFVPVGLLIGSIDVGLLLSIALAQGVGLFLVYRAIWEVSDRSVSTAATATTVMASAPLFIGLSHYYLVEMLQMVAVAWFVLIMACAPKWPRVLTASQLVSATAFAMLAKASSPLVCWAPGLVALYYLVRPREGGIADNRQKLFVTLGLGAPLAAATAAWYYRHIRDVMAHVSLATSEAHLALTGKQEAFLPSLGYWLSAVQANFMTPLTVFVVAATVIVGTVVTFAKPDIRVRRFYVVVGAATVQVTAVLVVFSLRLVPESRYLLPLLPYFVLILSYCVWRLDRRLVTLVVIAAFAIQWGHTHLQALGLIDRARGGSPWLNIATTDGSNKAIMNSIVLRTCAEREPDLYRNAIGVQLLWLNAPAASYAAAKAFSSRSAVACEYEALAYFDPNEDEAWHRVISTRTRYFVGVEPGAYGIPPDAVYETANKLNGQILQRVERSGLFRLEHHIDEHKGVLIFKRLDRIDHVATGRALSDQGMHQQAIDELNKATLLEPANVEAWANLALAHERAGDTRQALAAWLKARGLNQHHYYVNLGLARALLQQQEWRAAVERAADAISDAPGVQERVSALALAARGSFLTGDSRRGCDFLREAAELQPSREMLDEVSRNGCGR